jgi:hypothetical protein
MEGELKYSVHNLTHKRKDYVHNLRGERKTPNDSNNKDEWNRRLLSRVQGSSICSLNARLGINKRQK